MEGAAGTAWDAHQRRDRPQGDARRWGGAYCGRGTGGDRHENVCGKNNASSETLIRSRCTNSTEASHGSIFHDGPLVAISAFYSPPRMVSCELSCVLLLDASSAQQAAHAVIRRKERLVKSRARPYAPFAKGRKKIDTQKAPPNPPANT